MCLLAVSFAADGQRHLAHIQLYANARIVPRRVCACGRRLRHIIQIARGTDIRIRERRAVTKKICSVLWLVSDRRRLHTCANVCVCVRARQTQGATVFVHNVNSLGVKN